MSFQPVLPLGGLGGWAFLNRTLETQQASFARAPVIQREAAYFRERIGQIDTAEELVGDPRLLKVALGAFGLEADLPNRFFIRKVLEEGAIEPRSLANRLSDKRYLELTRAFGFGDFDTPRTRLSDFADRMIAAYETRQFEVAVGNRDETMRLALNLRRELGELAGTDRSERVKWFTVMGTPPLRQVFETAYGLPQAFGALDVDRQLDILEQRTRRAFGEGGVAQFADPERMEELVRQFLIRAEIAGGGLAVGTRGSAALQMLQAASAPGLFRR